jgi:hypothetical protein
LSKLGPDFFNVGDLKKDHKDGNCSTDAEQEKKLVRLFTGEGSGGLQQTGGGV